jgi:hypothetical protein
LRDENINLDKNIEMKQQNIEKVEMKQQNIEKVEMKQQNIEKVEIKQQNIEKVEINTKKVIIYKENIFIVKPDIQNDVYHLYLDNQYKGVAGVPDYKTSVMLNNLFRNIKENIDLDALEESDNEEEFENPNLDKFVYLERTYKMICNFNKKFKKWVPIKVYK